MPSLRERAADIPVLVEYFTDRFGKRAGKKRFFAKRMSVITYELDSSHVPMLSQPDRVLDVIRTAAQAVGARSTAA